MRRKISAWNSVVGEYAIIFYSTEWPPHICTLCGNSGIVDTRGVTSARGRACGRLNYCICPNGQTLRQLAPNAGQDELEQDLRRSRE